MISYECTCDPMLAREKKTDYTYTRQTILELPQWSKERKRKLQNKQAPTICVDKCIVACIERLWEIGIETTGCCCGHNINRAWVSVDPEDYRYMFEAGFEQKQVNVVDGHAMGLYTFLL